MKVNQLDDIKANLKPFEDSAVLLYIPANM